MRNANFVPLHRRIRPCNSPAREHGDADIVRNGVPPHADIVTVPPDFVDRHHAEPYCQVELFSKRARGFTKRLPRAPRAGTCTGKAGPITAKYDAKIQAVDRV